MSPAKRSLVRERARFEPLEARVLLSGGVYGHVYAQGGAALQGITVNVYQGPDPNNAGDEAWDWVTSADTDASGYFSLGGLDARHYHLRIPEGVQSGACHYLGGDLYDVAVVDQQTTPDQDFTLRIAGYIYGYVKNADGDPIKNVQVLVRGAYVEDGNDWHTADTDAAAAGRYEVFLADTNLKVYPVGINYAYDPGQTYKVYASNATGALSGDLYGDLEAQGFTYLGSAHETQTFTGGYKSYVIRVDFGNCAQIDAIEAGVGSFYSGGLTTGNVQGHWNVTGPPNDNGAVMGETGWPTSTPSYLGVSYGTAPASLKVHVVDQGLADEPVFYGVQVAPDLYAASISGTRGPDFTLSVGGLIHGRVTSESGEGLEGVELDPQAAIPNGFMTDPDGVANASGDYYIPSVPAGIGVSVMTETEWQYYECQGQKYSAGERVIGPLTITPGGIAEAGTLVIQRAATIHGTVRDSVGDPIAEVTVALYGFDQSGGGFWEDFEAETDANGQYVIDYAPAGQLWIVARKEGFGGYASPSVVNAAPGGDYTHNMTLTAVGEFVTVTGAVTNFANVAPKDGSLVLPFNLIEDYDCYGRACELGVVAWNSSTPWSSEDFLNPERRIASFGEVEDGYDDYFVPNGNGGQFTVGLPPGECKIQGYRFDRSANGAGMNLLSNPITVNGTPGQTISGQNITFPTGTATIAGELTLPGSWSAAWNSTKVWVMRTGENFPVGFSEPAPGGGYALEALPAGSYYLCAVAPGLPAITSQTFNLATGQTRTQDFNWNHVPSLTKVDTLTGASEDTGFVITYDMLAAAADEFDGDGDPIHFRIEAVSSGSLTKGGNPVIPGTTMLSPGQSINWLPATNANGTLNAFTVKAWDGAAASPTAVQVKVQVAPTNDPPVAANDVAMVYQNTVNNALYVLGNDTDVDGDQLSVSAVTPAGHGTAALVSGTVYYTPQAGYVGFDGFSYSVSDGHGGTATAAVNITVSPGQQNVQVVIGDQPQAQAKTVTYTDANNTLVTVTHKGGTSAVQFSGNGLTVVPGKGGLVVAGTNLRIEEILVSPKDERSSLSFKTKGGGAFADIGAITGSAPLGKLSAKTMNLVGVGINMTGQGCIGSIQLHDINNGADIAMDGLVPKGVAIACAWIHDDTDISLSSYLKSLVATRWDGGALKADLGALSINVKGDKKSGTVGDFGADLELSGHDARGNSLGKFTAAGNITGSTWRLTHGAGAITAAGFEAGWKADFGTSAAWADVGSIASKNGNVSGTISARSIASISAKGNVVAANVNLFRKPDAKLLALGKLSAGGWIDDTTINSTGTVGSVSSGGIRNSSIFAGLAAVGDSNTDDVCDLPQMQDFAPPDPNSGLLAGIKSLKLKGIKQGKVYLDSIINSNIGAGWLGSIDLCYADLTNGSWPFGVAGMSLQGKVSYKDGDPTHKFMMKPGQLPPGWLDPTDLEIRLA